MTNGAPDRPARTVPGFTEFVAMVASLMAMTALAIDAMLPALPAIGEALDVAADNDRQLVIGALLIGFGLAQIVHGPLSDRFGRRPLLVGGLGLYAASSVVAAFAQSFELLLAARFCQGIAVAATRVLAISIVRDLYVGRKMAQVMSFAMMVFMAVPVLAPLFGEIILAFASWRWIFWMFAAIGIGVGLWIGWRLPETLSPEDRLPLTPARIGRGWRHTVTERKSLGYMLASAMLSGALFGFINSIQQVMYDTFDRPDMLVPAFAMIAGTMSAASLLNSRIVLRLGTRLVSHSALLAFIGFAAAGAVMAYTGNKSLWVFLILLSANMGAFGLCGANFGAMAMEEMGAIAGTASSVQGAVGVLVGAVIGGSIGQMYDGTTLPLSLGFLVCGSLALVSVLATERGRLFNEDELANEPARV
ncbi:multidrug effflux MFS transporter [Parasphingopyxis algicola]|uniref:multidrug effflux MFS transporter n=1 Tax=Parasphingopyxis algicola TaxID=2026624 RepID=UPI0015A0D943|nr:multidrug effflux MFS transporter [Parasphingopyxis algicola]QLC25944.1 multidrug effflux MFS transporter [Parasphingopyxis algicola]